MKGFVMKRILKDIFAAVGVITVCKAFCDNYEVVRKRKGREHDAEYEFQEEYADEDIFLDTQHYKRIYFENHVDSANAFDDLKICLQKFGKISVADYYDICGTPGMILDRDYMYGWRTVNGVGIKPHRDYANSKVSWYIALPDPIKL